MLGASCASACADAKLACFDSMQHARNAEVDSGAEMSAVLAELLSRTCTWYNSSYVDSPSVPNFSPQGDDET